MDSPPIAAIAALIGEPARALMLSSLMSGRAQTASELAAEAGVTRQTASAHLAKLVQGNLITVVSQGRHRYFTLSSPEIADALEMLMMVGEQHSHTSRAGVKSLEREGRSCYDHLAGRLGVKLFDQLSSRGHIEIASSQVALTRSGEELIHHLGISLEAIRRRRRMFVSLCLDWSERRYHLGGAVGSALLEHSLEAGWLCRHPHSRAVTLSRKGKIAFGDIFGVWL